MANWRPGLVFIGGETSGQLRRRFQAYGHECYSADLLRSEDFGEDTAYSDDGFPLGRHLTGDMFETLDNLWANDLWPDLAIFHITCTYLTNSAEWAFKDPDYARYPGVGYHQRVKPGTLTGAARRQAREAAKDEFRRVRELPIACKIVENPVGALSAVMKPTQIVQPYEFGDDASKATCLWMLDKDGSPVLQMRLPIDSAKRVAGRLVTYPRSKSNLDLGYVTRERWSNQTDSGQNRLSPADERWKERSRTYPGIADAIVAKCASLLCG